MKFRKLLCAASLCVLVMTGCDNASLQQYRRQPVAVVTKTAQATAQPSQAKTSTSKPTESIVAEFASFALSDNVLLALIFASLIGFFGWVATGGYAKDWHGNPR